MTLDGTNTWILRAPGRERCLVVDPGPLDEEHLAAVAAHGPVHAVLITHGHWDHTEGVPRILALTGAQLVADPASVAGEVGLRVDRVYTPGHTADSVCFRVSMDGAEPAVLTGDTILGRGTTVVASPDGDLGDYLASLRLLAGVGPVPVLPGHGPPLADCSAAASYYLRHREARLDQVRAALASGAGTAEEVVARVYADVDRSLWPAATQSVLAQLKYLRRESHPPFPELDEP
jgi:glyoxylase-like metal-dependent hydrolase (beta-lactamase superfamily II)